MSHAEPTFCIKVPMFDTNWAMNSAKKMRYRNGLHGDVNRGIGEGPVSLTSHQPRASTHQPSEHAIHTSSTIGDRLGAPRLAVRSPRASAPSTPPR